MRKSLLLGVVILLAGAASVDAGIFGHRGGGCSNGSCGKSYYGGGYGGGYGGYVVTAKTATVAQSRPQSVQVTERTSVVTSSTAGNTSTVAAQTSQAQSYQTPARNTSTARGRVLRRWAR